MTKLMIDQWVYTKEERRINEVRELISIDLKINTELKLRGKRSHISKNDYQYYRGLF